MKTRTLKQLVLYNYRYIFGYCIVILFGLYFLSWRLGSLVPGLAPLEMQTAANNASVQSFLQLPLYPLHSIIQFATTQVLGFTALSIRLPSVIIGAATVVVLYFLLKRWFGKPTALMSSALIISADWFLHIARLGSGSIEFSFWLSLALLGLTRVLERKSLWLMVFSISTAALLFVPFGPYVSLTLISSLLGYTALRKRLHESSTPIKAIGFVVLLVSVSAASYASYQNIDFLKQLLAIDSMPGIRQYFVNLFYNTGSVVAILPNSNPVVSPTSITLIRFFELIFILFGVVMLFKTRVNRLNLTLITLSIVLVLASGFDSSSRATGLFIVPAAIFMTGGIRHLIHRWKRTFPNNPYARIVAYVPLAVLFLCVVAVHYVSYFQLWAYQSSTQQAFSVDSQLVIERLNDTGLSEQTCFVETEDLNMQTIIKGSETICRPIFSEASLAERESAKLIILKPDSTLLADSNLKPSQPLASATREQNVRWLVVNRSKN